MAQFLVKVEGLHKGAFEVESVDIYNALSGLFDGVTISVEAAEQHVQTAPAGIPWCKKCCGFHQPNEACY